MDGCYNTMANKHIHDLFPVYMCFFIGVGTGGGGGGGGSKSVKHPSLSGPEAKWTLVLFSESSTSSTV